MDPFAAVYVSTGSAIAAVVIHATTDAKKAVSNTEGTAVFPTSAVVVLAGPTTSREAVIGGRNALIA